MNVSYQFMVKKIFDFKCIAGTSRLPMQLVAGLAIAVCGGGALASDSGGHQKAPASHSTYTLEHVDEIIAKRGLIDAEGSASFQAWSNAYIAEALAVMYRATGDTGYLDQLAERCEVVRSRRSDRMGEIDYRGRQTPGWSMSGDQNSAEVTIFDRFQRPILRFRGILSKLNNRTEVQLDQHSDTTFTISISNSTGDQGETFENVSLDPQSERFIESIVNRQVFVPIEMGTRVESRTDGKGSNLVRVEVIRSDPRGGFHDGAEVPIGDDPVRLEPLRAVFHAYDGQILFPMLEFAHIVLIEEPGLQATYGETAQLFIKEARQVLEEAEENWRDGPDPGEGYYVFGPYGFPFWADNVGAPFNYLNSLGAALIRLHQVTGEALWRERAEAIGMHFKNRLRLTDEDGYVWDYWWGIANEGWSREDQVSFNRPQWSGRPKVEDIAHGQQAAKFIAVAVEAGIVFDETEARRFGNTVTRQMYREDEQRLSYQVDGAGYRPKSAHAIGHWLDLAPYHPDLAPLLLQVMKTEQVHERAASPVVLYAIAKAAALQKADKGLRMEGDQ